MELVQGNGELVIKELAVDSDGVIQTSLFSPPYSMAPHGSAESGLNWNDGHIPYAQVQTVLTKAVAHYDHLYARGYDKCELLMGILNRPIYNCEDIQGPDPQELKAEVNCYLICHAYPHMRCATRNAYAQHCWLEYHLKTKSYLKCPSNHGRQTPHFASSVPKPNAVM
jgi:hypothetical protein